MRAPWWIFIIAVIIWWLAGCVAEERPSGERYEPRKVEHQLERVCECIGMCAPLPPFYKVANDSLNPYDGLYWWDTEQVFMEEEFAHDRSLMRHELIHHVLHWNGTPVGENNDHTSTAWNCE